MKHSNANNKQLAQSIKTILPTKGAPQVTVGIMCVPDVHVVLQGKYDVGTATAEGSQHIIWQERKLCWDGKVYDTLTFVPQTSSATFALSEVTIGVHFHWEQRETQVFSGSLSLKATAEGIQVLNSLSVEDYLKSVISSEMSSSSDIELLKAHTVISRSWLLAQMEKRCSGLIDTQQPAVYKDAESIIKWYDREDHQGFDVCADDHCQRYQGLTRANNPNVEKAVQSTFGQTLMYDGQICDARFSKCCGGVLEEFQFCWQDESKPYLKALADNPNEQNFPDLTNEAQAAQWIKSSPASFCNTTDQKVLSQVLNHYDLQTTDFYRWKVSYDQQELSQLISSNLAEDFGRIKALEPVQRGKSGRLSRLRIVGEFKTIIIGKELEIRRTLSDTHLFSSAFVVDTYDVDAEGYPQHFVLTGAGWGHGVGLCQIGAAMMSEQGYRYKEILNHYYPDAVIAQLYEDEDSRERETV